MARVCNVVIHGESTSACSRAKKVAVFHADVIAHRLRHLNISIEQKVSIINNIMKSLKAQSQIYTTGSKH